MIINAHPILKLLDEIPWKAHLVGSRYVGVFDRDKSDYDFLVECDDWHKSDGLRNWLGGNGFSTIGTEGYGPDRRLHASSVWTRKDDGFPAVDILPMTPEEAAMRLRFFAAMREQGHDRGGLLALTLKRGKGWATLWECLSDFMEQGQCGGI